MDNKKIAIIICNTKENISEHLLNELKKTRLPVDWQGELLIVDDIGGKGKTYNQAMKQSDANIKIYIDESAVELDSDLLANVLRIVTIDNKIGLWGAYGSELPLNAEIFASELRYGRCCTYADDGTRKKMLGENPLFHQVVGCIDSMMMVTTTDVEWDEDVADEFLGAAAACRYKESGLKTAVFMQSDFQVSFAKTSVYDNKICLGDDYEEKKEVFFSSYKNHIQPLVSICMTTYNQPVFFKQALDSALAQTYGNIEIVIGDDSTNNDTEFLMQEYLAKYPFIHYYHHAKPLGRIGRNNLDFVINNCNGEYINILFHDDIFYPQKIERMMEYYLKDIEDKVSFVTSDRYLIDEYSNVVGYINPWRNTNNVMLDSKDVGEKILKYGINFVGEMTTVLLRRSDIYVKELGGYYNSYFYTYRDNSLGDVSTWLELCRKRDSVVFIHESLSAARRHSQQNTFDAAVQVSAPLDWMIMCMSAFENKIYINTQEEFGAACRLFCRQYKTAWLFAAEHGLLTNQNDEVVQVKKAFLDELCVLVDENKFDDVLDCLKEYAEQLCKY